jgi:putative transposase
MDGPELAVNAVTSAGAPRGGRHVVSSCVVHSDRGSQFRSRKFVQVLLHNGLR